MSHEEAQLRIFEGFAKNYCGLFDRLWKSGTKFRHEELANYVECASYLAAKGHNMPYLNHVADAYQQAQLAND